MIMANGKYKDLAKRTRSDKVLRGKVFKITINPNYDGYGRGLASVVFKFFDKKPASDSSIKSMSNQQKLANELYKPFLITFIKIKIYSLFKGNI